MDTKRLQSIRDWWQGPQDFEFWDEQAIRESKLLKKAREYIPALVDEIDRQAAEIAALTARVERLSAADDMELNSDIEHEIWSSWMQYMFMCGYNNADGSWTMPADKVERWKRQMNTPYRNLSEKEKSSDREQVQKHWDAWERRALDGDK